MAEVNETKMADFANKLKKYKIKLRKENQIVTHQMYGTRTVLTPEQFAWYELAIKSIYTHLQINHSVRKMYNEFLGCMVYHQNLADPNDIYLPYIPDKPKLATAEQAYRDYGQAVNYLQQHDGKDAENGEPRNLYYACLD